MKNKIMLSEYNNITNQNNNISTKTILDKRWYGVH